MESQEPLKMFTELLVQNEKNYGDIVYLRQPINGVYHEYTWAQTMEKARRLVSFLKDKGLKKGDKVAIFSKNCAEWIIADFAIAIGGFISVPIFANQQPELVQYVLNHAEAKLIFVGKLDNGKIYDSFIPSKLMRVSFPYENGINCQFRLTDIVCTYKPVKSVFIPKADDLYTIIYTSGSTGHPKGVMVSYDALRGAQVAIRNFIDSSQLKRLKHFSLFSYLPLAHIFDRMIGEYLSVVWGDVTTSFAESLETFQKNLQDASPSAFASVPRLWMQFQQGVFKHLPQEKLDRLLKIPILNYFVKKKIKGALGLDKSLLNFTGSAPLSPSILKWYEKLGIEILEGYGRTEDLAIGTLNPTDKNRTGTVGKPHIGVEIKIDESGEILTRSPYMMSGYYKDKKATQKVFTKDGFMRTGDLGMFDEEGYLIILGRKSDPFKTDKGEFVNPLPIEAQFAKNHYIEQLCCIGEHLPQPVLLVVLSERGQKTTRDEVAKSLERTLKAVNEDLPGYAKLSHVFIVNEHWFPENGLLTPTLKVKRHAMQGKYLPLATKHIKTKEPIIWE